MSAAAASNINELTAVEVMREELRNVVVEERKSHRGAALNKNRWGLGEIRDNKRSWDSEIVARKARQLKKRPLPVEDYLCLQSALIQNEANINSFLSVGNVLTALVRDISGGNPALQLLAANCSCNIALGNSRACVSITKAAGPYLVAQLDTMNYPLVEVCAWTVGNLAAGSETAFRAIWAQGCLKRLFALLNECDPSILSSVMYALKHCLHAGHDVMPDSEMIKLTEILIRRSWFDESETLWLLAFLSSKQCCAQLLCSIIPQIFDVLYAALAAKTFDVQMVTAAIRILGNTICEATKSSAETVLRYPVEKLTTMLDKLLSYPQNHVRKETLWLAGNLYCHSSPEITQITRNLCSSLLYLHRAIESNRDVGVR